MLNQIHLPCTSLLVYLVQKNTRTHIPDESGWEVLTGFVRMLSRLLSMGSALSTFPALGNAFSGAGNGAGTEAKVGESIGSFFSSMGGTCAAVAIETEVG